jgi:hypothetical protein
MRRILELIDTPIATLVVVFDERSRRFATVAL